MLWNRMAETYTADEVIGQPSKLTPPEARKESQSLFERAINGEITRNVEVRRARKDGSLIHVRVAVAPMYNIDGTVRGVARAYEDITDSRRAQEQLSRLAHYDPLTGLPNLMSLQKELGRLLAGCERSPVSIALFDLDGFKDVNDTLGHSTGDQLLIEVCQRFIEVIDELKRATKVCQRRRVRHHHSGLRRSARGRGTRRSGPAAPQDSFRRQRQCAALRQQRRHCHRAQ